MTEVRLVQLMAGVTPPAASGLPDYRAMATPAGLREIATYADGIGPEKSMILPDWAGEPTALVADAHAAGLVVHPWTFRAENLFLPTPLRSGADMAAHGDLRAEIRRYIALGVDGFFTDYPYEGVQARVSAAVD